jgi:hypothetical protein
MRRSAFCANCGRVYDFMDRMSSWCPRCIEARHSERAARTPEERAPGVRRKTLADVLAERRPPRPTRSSLPQDHALPPSFKQHRSRHR